MQQRHHQEIFDTWLAQHRGLLFKVVRAYAFTPHDRDDLFQEITTQVWHSIPRFRAASAVTTWLYRVALHTALAWTRQERRHRARTEPLDGREPMLTETSQAADRRLNWLYEQIAQLDEVDRALTLLLLDGFTHRDIATTLGLSEGNVGVKIHRIKNHLADKSREEINHGL